MKKKVAIIGSGTAGATSAIYLHKMGYDVTVFERELTPKPVGAGIMLQPTGLNTLADLGLVEKALSLGTKVSGMDGSTLEGNKIIDLDFDNRFELFGLGIHRSALYFMLFDELKRLGIPVKLGCEINNINNSTDTITLSDTQNNSYSDFDWTIVANGARSLLREKRDIVKKSNEQKFGAVWTKIAYDNNFFDNKIHQIYKGSHKMIGFMPIGKASNDSKEYVNFFWSINMKDVEKWKNTSLEDWKKEAIALAPKFKDVINLIKSKDELTVAPYMDVVLKPSFDKNIVFIGDSAHPMSPQLAQGASFAMLDARVLSEQIEKYPNDLAMAFVSYHRLRSKQVNFFQNISRSVTPMFQSETKNPWFRDFIMKIATKQNPFKKILISTILGYREGLCKNIDKKYFLS